MNYIIVDLDGTLCNCDHRRHFVEQKPKDWKSFFEGIEDDQVNEWCKNIIETYYKGYPKETYIILLTGRSEEHEKATRAWLLDNRIFYNRLIFARKKNDFRPDTELKLEIYKNHIEPGMKGKKPLFVIDDRKSVVDMWREQGITCLQCAEGDF